MRARWAALTKVSSVIEVVAGGRGEPGRHARVGRVNRGIHVDLTTSTHEPTVWATMVHGSPRVAETVKHVLKQGRKSRDGSTHHNGAIRRPRGWRRDSHPSVNNKEETSHHFIH
jgi:hypothetical protein